MGTFDWNLRKLLSCLKSAASNLTKCKVSYETKKLILGQKICFTFMIQFEENTTILDISMFQFAKIQNSM